MHFESPRHSAEAPHGAFDSPDFAWTPRPVHVQARLRLLRRALGSRRRPLKLLDLGCGAAENTLPVAAGLGAVEAFGLDAADTALSQARTRGLAVVQGALDHADLPFPTETFDVVMLAEVIEHLVDTDHVLVEARRVLKPGGVLLVTTPNLAAWFNRALLAVGFQPAFSEVSTRKVYGRPGSQVVGHLRLFTRRALVGLLEDVGFANIVLAGASFHDVPRPLRWLDRLMARWPGGASILLAAATKRPT